MVSSLRVFLHNVAFLSLSSFKVLSTFVKEQAILAKVPDGATLQSEAALQPKSRKSRKSRTFEMF